MLCAPANRLEFFWDVCWKLSSDSQNVNDLPAPLPSHKNTTTENLGPIRLISQEDCKPNPLPTTKIKMGTSPPIFHSLMESLLCQLVLKVFMVISPPTPSPPGEICNPTLRPCHGAGTLGAVFLPSSEPPCFYLCAAFYILTCIFSLFLAVCVLSPQPSVKGLWGQPLCCVVYTQITSPLQWIWNRNGGGGHWGCRQE